MAIVTKGQRGWGEPIWTDIQEKIDAGYFEPASHSRTHYHTPYRHTGSHTGSDNEHYTLTDSGADFCLGLTGAIINNIDGSSCTITSNTKTTIICSGGLSGGTDNDWDNGDEYTIDCYEFEIGGSKQDILDNLDLPALNKKGSTEYLYAWIEPGGGSDADQRAKCGEHKYLSDRSAGTRVDSFASWDATNGVYNRIAGTVLMGVEGTTDINTLNNAFDNAYSNGKIYHLWFHTDNTTTPGCFGVDLSKGSYFYRHLDYIKDKKDVWYVGFGHLYAYRYAYRYARCYAYYEVMEDSGQDG